MFGSLSWYGTKFIFLDQSASMVLLTLMIHSVHAGSFVDLVLSIDMKLSDVLNHFFDLKLLSLLVHSIRLVLSNIMVHSLMVILSLYVVHSWKVALSLVMIHFIPCGTISFHDSLSECGTNWCQGSLEAWFYHELWFSSWLRHYLFWWTTVSILVLSHFRVRCKYTYLSRSMAQSLLTVLSLRLIHSTSPGAVFQLGSLRKRETISFHGSLVDLGAIMFYGSLEPLATITGAVHTCSVVLSGGIDSLS